MNKFDLHTFGLPSFGGDGDGGRKAANVKFKGYYTTELTLKTAHPSPKVGDIAWVGAEYPGVVYRCDVAGTWLATTDVPPSNTVNLSDYATKTLVDVRTTEYNVSVQHPTSGLDGTNKYTLSGAIALIPVALRSVGLKCSFLNVDGKVETWEYQGVSFMNVENWIQQIQRAELSDVKDDLTHLSGEVGVFNFSKEFNYQAGYSLNYQNNPLDFIAIGNILSIRISGWKAGDILYFGLLDPAGNRIYRRTITTDNDQFKYTIEEEISMLSVYSPAENVSSSGILKVEVVSETVLNRVIEVEHDFNNEVPLLINNVVNANGNSIQTIDIKKNILVTNNSGSGDIGYWTSFNGYNSYIFDVSKQQGTSILVNGVNRANSFRYVFVTDYTKIPTSLDIETWEEVFISGGKGLTTGVIVQGESLSIPNGYDTLYLIISGTDENIAGAFRKGDNSIPLYILDEIDRVRKIVAEKQHNDITIIGFNTDQHLEDNTKDATLLGLNGIRELSKYIPMTAIALGGDTIGATNNTTDIINTTYEVNEAVVGSDCLAVSLAGNHEAYQNNGGITGKDMFNANLKKNAIQRKVIWSNNVSTDCYFDDDTSKIRFIFLDSSTGYTDPWTSQGSESLYSRMTEFLNNCLNDEKLLSQESDWSAVIISHHPINSNLQNITEGARNLWGTITPFLSQGLKLICCINGHGHADYQDVADGVNFIQTQNASILGKHVSFDGVAYHKGDYRKTVKETSQDIFIIDQTDKMIYAIRWGAGTNRTFSYSSENLGIILLTLTIATNIASTVTITNAGATYISKNSTTHVFPYCCPNNNYNVIIEASGYDAINEVININANIEKNYVLG